MIDNISKLVAEKHQGEIPSTLHDQIRELENALVRFKERYAVLKDREYDLKQLGVKSEDIKEEINKIIHSIVG